jgi:hypothetical protein
VIVRPPAGRRAAPVRRAGLSLLEVLLALAIFLFSLAAIGALVEFGNERSTAAAMLTTATRLAQAKLAEVEAGSIPVATGGSGTFDDEPEWNWSVEAGAATVPNVYPVTVRVWREVAGQTHEVTLTQMVFDPLQMGNAAEAQPPETETTGTTGTTTGSTTPSGSGR